MTVNLIDRLKEFGKDMKDWEEMKTSVEGVIITKMPSKGDDLNFGLKIIPMSKLSKSVFKEFKKFMKSSVTIVPYPSSIPLMVFQCLFISTRMRRKLFRWVRTYLDIKMFE